MPVAVSDVYIICVRISCALGLKSVLQREE